MTSEIVTRKHEQIFDLFDVDRNGYVAEDDITALAERLVVAFPGAPAEKIGTVRAVYANFWADLAAAADTDGDGKISRQEFAAAFGEVATATPTSFDDVMKPVPQAVFNLIDVDGDGRVDAGEFRAFHAALGTGDPDAARALAVLDNNHDGVLTVDELMRAAREFVLSEDPQAPGNWLFGGI